jgi:hypothetical protein
LPLDRLLKLVTPQPDLGFTPPPDELAPGIWSIARRARLLGLTLPTRSTVLAIGSGELAVISPPFDACPALEKLGRVTALIASNPFHHLYAKPFAARHPGARLYIAPGLRERMPGFDDASVLGADASPPWRRELDFALIGPSRGISELVFFHRASASLLLTDLAFNLQGIERGIERLLWRLSGAPAGFGPSRNARRLLLRDRASYAAALRTIASWPFERIVVAHGDPVLHDARATFERAFAAYL